MTKYRVEIATRPSPGLAYYEGTVDVAIEEDDDAETGDLVFAAAVRELRRTSFPDRGANCWRLVSFFRV